MIEVENTPVWLEWVRGALIDSGYTREMWREEVRFTIVPPYDDSFPFLPPPPSFDTLWYELLPPAPTKTPLRVIRQADVWRDTTRTSKHSTHAPGSTMDYWGRHQDGFLCVFDSPTLQLWVWHEDVERA